MIGLINEHNIGLGGHALFVDYSSCLETARQHWLSGKWEAIECDAPWGIGWRWFFLPDAEYYAHAERQLQAWRAKTEADRLAHMRARDPRGRP